MHDASHSGRLIIEGVEEPTEGMTLTMLGQAGGEGTVTVREVGGKLSKDERWFTGLAVFDTSQRKAQGGDSGAACLYQVSDNRYKMSCIQFAGIVDPGTTAWAFPASVAQQKLGITFGEKVVLKDLVLNKQAGFDEDHFGPWQALTDFSNNALSLDTIGRVRQRLPQALVRPGGTQHQRGGVPPLVERQHSSGRLQPQQHRPPGPRRPGHQLRARLRAQVGLQDTREANDGDHLEARPRRLGHPFHLELHLGDGQEDGGGSAPHHSPHRRAHGLACLLPPGQRGRLRGEDRGRSDEPPGCAIATDR